LKEFQVKVGTENFDQIQKDLKGSCQLNDIETAQRKVTLKRLKL
jgi:hypothetical protein